jgi:hypothetical protein
MKKIRLDRIDSTARTKLQHRIYLIPGTYRSYDHRIAGGERVDIFAIFDLKKGKPESASGVLDRAVGDDLFLGLRGIEWANLWYEGPRKLCIS